jgi:hypothetical protein
MQIDRPVPDAAPTWQRNDGAAPACQQRTQETKRRPNAPGEPVRHGARPVANRLDAKHVRQSIVSGNRRQSDNANAQTAQQSSLRRDVRDSGNAAKFDRRASQHGRSHHRQRSVFRPAYTDNAA